MVGTNLPFLAPLFGMVFLAGCVGQPPQPTTSIQTTQGIPTFSIQIPLQTASNSTGNYYVLKTYSAPVSSIVNYTKFANFTIDGINFNFMDDYCPSGAYGCNNRYTYDNITYFSDNKIYLVNGMNYNSLIFNMTCNHEYYEIQSPNTPEFQQHLYIAYNDVRYPLCDQATNYMNSLQGGG